MRDDTECSDIVVRNEGGCGTSSHTLFTEGGDTGCRERRQESHVGEDI